MDGCSEWRWYTQNGRWQWPTHCKFLQFLCGWVYFFADPGVFGLGVFLEMVGILEGLAPPPGRRGVSEVSEQTDRASWSSDASEASLPRRLLALLPARLPARLVGPLAVDPPRLGSNRRKEGNEKKKDSKNVLTKAEHAFVQIHI